MSNLANTEMACLDPEGVTEQETAFFAFMRDARTFRLELQIFRSDGAALTFVRQGPQAQD